MLRFSHESSAVPPSRPRKRTWASMLCLLAFLSPVGAGPVRTPPPDKVEAPALHKQLATCRAGIVDPRARPEERRRWVEMLFTYDTPAADALVSELLGPSHRPAVQGAVCEVMAQHGRTHPGRLRDVFVEPLMLLLAAKTEPLGTSAARALAEFPGREVPDRLGAMAAQPELATGTRLAIVNAFAPNTHRREVVEQLIGLLDLDVPEVTDRVAEVLGPIAPQDFGSNAARWRSWWDGKKNLSNEAWLAEQLKLFRHRARQSSSDLAAVRGLRERDDAAVAVRIRDFQREILRSLTPPQRVEALASWIDDPIEPVKVSALAIVRSRIADEGKRPEGALLAALLRLLGHESSTMRREALSIVQNLSDPAVVEAVLARLGQERDTATRVAIFQAMSRIASPAAIPALIREIAAADSDPVLVREAATALGHVAAKPEARDALQGAVAPLKQRYGLVSADDVGLRSALLTAMAGVADVSMAPELLEAVESDDPSLVEPAIRGLLAIGNASKLPRIRTLTSQSDVRVRLAAIDAISSLGREDADLEMILTRLNPAIEASGSVRQAAWRGFRALLSSRPIVDRISASERLRELGELEALYLEELAGVMSTAGQHTAELEVVRDRLSTILVRAGQDAEAIPHLAELYEARFARADPQTQAVGLRWLSAVLRSPNQQGVAQVVVRLSETTTDESFRGEIVATISRYADSEATVVDADRTRRLISALRTVRGDILGEAWSKLLDRVAARLALGESRPGERGTP